MEGKIVCWIQNRGFRFIQAANDKEYFFHISNCISEIALGADVEFQAAPPIRLGKGSASNQHQGHSSCCNQGGTMTAQNPLVETVRKWRRDFEWTDSSIKTQLRIAHRWSSDQVDEILAEAFPKDDAPSNGRSTEQEIMTAATIEQTEEKQPPAPVDVPEWEMPAHTLIDLATADPDALGLDPTFNDDDVVLNDAIAEAKRKAETSAPALIFFESIALPLVGRGWKVAPCYPRDKKIHTRLVPKPLEMRSDNPEQIHAWGLAEPNANVCVYADQVEGGLLFLDKDGAISLREKFERETGKQFPKTLLVRSFCR